MAINNIGMINSQVVLPTSNLTIQPKRLIIIIGGLFGSEFTPNHQDVIPPFLSGRDISLVNARSGIWLLVNRLRPPQVWIPSYLCHTIIGAIDPISTNIRFYDVDYDLKIRSKQWISQFTSGDLVVFNDYFGFSYDRKFSVSLKEKGAWILEDTCQALLSSHVGNHSDFVLFSSRKWIGVLDRGILRLPENFLLGSISLETPTSAWWLKALRASLLRREFDEGLPMREWYKLFREAEDIAPTGPYAMSQHSKIIIESLIDHSVVAKKRINNYLTLLDKMPF